MPRKKNLYTNYFYINYYIQVSKNLNDKSSKKSDIKITSKRLHVM